MPARKKAKTEQPGVDSAPGRDSRAAEVDPPLPECSPKEVEQSPQPVAGNTDQSTGNDPKPQSTTSWYGGSWPRSQKSNTVVQVAKESITVAGNATTKAASDQVESTCTSSPRPLSTSSPLRSPASYLSRGVASSTRSLPLAAAPTKLNITSSANDAQIGTAADGLRRQSNTASKTQQHGNAEVKDELPGKFADQNGLPAPEPPKTLYSQRPPEEARSLGDTVSWLNWFTKIDTVGAKDSSRPQSITSPKSVASPPSPNRRRNSEPNLLSTPTAHGERSRSWLGNWGRAAKGPSDVPKDTASTATEASAALDRQTPDKDGTKAQSAGQPSGNTAGAARPQGYGWAFWSQDDSKDLSGKERRPNNVGELALAGSPSQSKPENATVDESKGIPERVSKRPRPLSMQEEDDTSKAADNKAISNKGPGNSSLSVTSRIVKGAETNAKKETQNLVLPSFRNTYRITSRPGLIQQLSRLFQLGSSSDVKHLEISSARKVTRALAIGVHGYFPAPFIRSVLGQPTGTSIRFANSAASAIQKWCQDQGYSCDVEKVALEGEGKIAERLDLLWKLLLNWINKIRQADFVMIACHSQGVPVAMMLVAKLIAFGCVNSARIGVCAMAGVNMGPFIDYKSRWIGGSAAELFDFCVSDSQVSKDYEAALDVALRFGVRIVYIGSIDDQLVSLESSTFGAVYHPNIYRAVFVDGRVHAPDFLTHLVGFALKLRNLGISDHNLIRELSSPLAGSLYGGEGHSRIYDDEAVYYLAVEHALETTSVSNVPMQIQRIGGPNGQNPYILPFAMRGLLEEEYVKTELYGEITELIRQFDDWKPQKTVLKDVKFRLEGVRSRL